MSYDELAPLERRIVDGGKRNQRQQYKRVAGSRDVVEADMADGNRIAVLIYRLRHVIHPCAVRADQRDAS